MKFDIENAEVIFNQNGVTGKRILKQGNLEYLYLRFDSKSETKSHIQQNLMTFYIQNGVAKVIVDGIDSKVSKGELLVIQAGASRQWINLGNEVLELFVVKTIT